MKRKLKSTIIIGVPLSMFTIDSATERYVDLEGNVLGKAVKVAVKDALVVFYKTE